MNGNQISDGRLAEIDAQTISIARVKGVRDKHPTNHTMTWGERKAEVLAAAASPRRASGTSEQYQQMRTASKEGIDPSLPADAQARIDQKAAKDWCLAQKDGPATIGGECVADARGVTVRQGDNFPMWCTLALDVDPGNCPPEFFVALTQGSERLCPLGAAVWNETHSSTEDARALRIEALLKQPAPTFDRNAAGEVIAAAIEADFPGLVFDKAAIKKLQIMFDPSCPSDAPARAAGVLVGEPLDAMVLAAFIRPASESEKAQQEQREATERQGAQRGAGGGATDDAPEFARRAREILVGFDLRVESGHATTVAFACICPDPSHALDGVARAEWTAGGQWICRVCGKGGGVVSFVAALTGCENRDAFNRCRRALGLPERRYSSKAKDAKRTASASEDREEAGQAAQNRAPEDDDSNEGKRSQADILAGYGDECALFIDEADGDTAFADIIVDGHRETLRLASSQFRRWLQAKFYAEHKKTVRGEAVGQAIEALSARARFDSERTTHLVHLRSASYRGNIYIDLCNKEWSVVEVSTTGWRVVAEPPIRFRRSKGMVALPTPTVGDINRLREFVNLKADSDFVLFVNWLIHTLRGQKPFPLLSLLGQEGTAKSTLCLIAKALTDPNVNPLRSLPGNQQDMMVGAGGQHVIVYDNVSTMPPWLSDALCRMAYGSGASYRRLYSDDEEAVLAAARPVILNGITEHVTRGDLASRTVGVTLDVIPPEARRDEEEFWAAFEDARPAIFGALLDGLVQGLRTLPSIRNRNLPRMAGFARWGMACEGAYWKEGTFEAAYSANISAISGETLESESVIVALRSWLDAPERASGWEGATSSLLAVLTAGLAGDRPKDWPGSSQVFSGVLRRCAPALGGVGIHVTLSRKSSRSYVVITRGEAARASASSASSQPGSAPSDEADALDAAAQGTSPPEHPPKGNIDPESGDEADGNGGWVMP